MLDFRPWILALRIKQSVRAGPGGIASQSSLAIDAWLNATVAVAIAATQTRNLCTVILLPGRWVRRPRLRVQDTSHKSRLLGDLRKRGELDREGVWGGGKYTFLEHGAGFGYRRAD